MAPQGERGVQLGLGGGGGQRGAGLGGDVGDPHHSLILRVPVDDGI